MFFETRWLGSIVVRTITRTPDRPQIQPSSRFSSHPQVKLPEMTRFDGTYSSFSQRYIK